MSFRKNHRQTSFNKSFKGPFGPKPTSEKKKESKKVEETKVARKSNPLSNYIKPISQGGQRTYAPKKHCANIHHVLKTWSESKRQQTELEGDELGDPAPSLLLTDSNLVYTFMVASEHNYTSTAGGILNSVLDNDPSTTVEWASFTNLFSFVRIRMAEYRVCRAVATAIPTTTSVGAFRPIVVAPLIDNAGAPGSYASINDSPSSVIYQYAWDTSLHGLSVRTKFPNNDLPLWADTSVPASSTTYVGCPGGLQIYGEQLPVSTEVLFIVRRLVIEFTNRI
jgi:hypothetical protein